MKIEVLVRTALLGGALLVSPGGARAQVLLADDFNDNALDPSKWSTVLAFGNSAVTERGQWVELANRAQVSGPSVGFLDDVGIGVVPVPVPEPGAAALGTLAAGAHVALRRRRASGRR